MNLNYFETLIAVADDCPVAKSEIPAPRAGKPTVASLQYEMIAARPFALTQEDVLFESWLQRQEGPAKRTKAELARLRAEFFGKPQACLRASPLPKKHGFGLLFDAEGRVSLCPMESETYRRIVGGKAGKVTVVKAMRSKRA